MANFWEISETVLLENSSIKKSCVPIQFYKNRVASYTDLLENSSNRQLENSEASHRPFFTGKLIQTKCYLSYMFSVKKFEWMSFPVRRSSSRPGVSKNCIGHSWFLMDEFSSKTACVTRKMKISEKFLDEFSIEICQ